VTTLAARSVRYAYEVGRPVVDGVDLCSEAGAVHGIVGPNGSGKSTLLALLGGLRSPDEGEVVLDGRALTGLRRIEVARQVALVPQDTSVAFPFTAAEMVLLGRTPHHDRPWFDSSADLDAAEAAMRATGVLDLAARPFLDLSGGERQRVILARAFCQQPSVLLLDEPTSHLDLAHRIGLLELLRRRALDDGLAVVVVLHDLNLAARLCDELTLLCAGRAVASGKPQDVLTEDRVEAVFGVHTHRGTVPGTDTPFLIATSLAKPPQG
jgi:iron complex transport system ATP-binding protein